MAELIELIGQSSLVISMRMHGLIFGAVKGIPGIGISYQTPKIDALAEALDGMKSFSLEDLSEDAPFDAFISDIDNKVENLGEVSSRLLLQAKELGHKAVINTEILENKLGEVAARPKPKSKLVKRLLQLGISALLFYLLSTQISLSDSWKAITSADISLVLIALILRILAIYPTSSVWRRSLYFISGRNQEFTNKDRYRAFLIYFKSYFFDNLGLGSLGGDIYRAAEITKQSDVTTSAGSIVWERVSGATFLVWTAAALYFQNFILKTTSSLLFMILSETILNGKT